MTAQTPGCGSTSDARKRLASAAEAESEHELERLRAWKAEAMPLFDGLQDLGRALGLPLGTLVTGPAAVEAANALRTKAAETDELREAIEALIAAPDDTQWWPVQPYMDPANDDEVVEVQVLNVQRLRDLLASHSIEGGADRG